ncbi:hypothetical protein [Natronococcus occultus]|uniref:hypothetical protein n=1 Tax=Natronococcus occultus TaxID=29288 RepID=UPI0012F7EF88|nr:hypothetical protein [Natronococcus occultus]
MNVQTLIFDRLNTDILHTATAVGFPHWGQLPSTNSVPAAESEVNSTFEKTEHPVSVL